MKSINCIDYETNRGYSRKWTGSEDSITVDSKNILETLLDLNQPIFLVKTPRGDIGVPFSSRENHPKSDSGLELIASAPAIPIEQLGNATFKTFYNTRYAYYAGAMAHGIASQNMVVALGESGFMGSFGAAGIYGEKLNSTVGEIKNKLQEKPFAVNVIFNPIEPSLEQNTVDVLIKNNITIVEASAYMNLSPSIIQYRVSGLAYNSDGSIAKKHKIIAKVSRVEVATKFMNPAPVKITSELVQAGKITPEQAKMSESVPMADDITVEADSGGHTDNRPLLCLIPTMIALRNQIQTTNQYQDMIRVGAAGGISTPSAAISALMSGADYIVTGSINQACVEAGTSEHVRKLLAQADMADVVMAPSADMFELGVKVQLLKKGTLFPMRAQKLYDIYIQYDSLDQIPVDERERLENQIFHKKLDDIWEDTVKFFEQRDPVQIQRARENPKRKMALVFRWYLGLSSHWAINGVKEHEMNYQIWCGPAMGAFNAWARNTYLAKPENRKVVDIAKHILMGSAYELRINMLKIQGISFPSAWETYIPR